MEDELRQRLIEKLQKGEDLPVDWARFLFPPEKREYELVYHGKEREEDILANTLGNFASPHPRPNLTYEYKGYKPPKNGWKVDVDRMREMDRQGLLHFPSTKKGRIQPKQYLKDTLGNKAVPDVWTGIPPLQAQAAEKQNYPTQKPEPLIERVIVASSNEGDIVLDAFAGSGTTCAVAEKLGRRWIAIDCGKLATYTIQKRMLNLHREVGEKGPRLECKPFTLCNAGLYDFSKLKELPWESWRFFALQLFQCRDEPHKIGGVRLDGYLKGASVLVFNHTKNPGARFTEETLEEIHEAVGKRVGNKLFIIAPALTFGFQQDYIDLEDVRYYALRIPYPIEFAWKKGEHPKRGEFNPDFFIKRGDVIHVIEIKGDEEIAQPSDENIKKQKYAVDHFDLLNKWLKKEKVPVRYQFNFLTPKDLNQFFQKLRENDSDGFRSKLDVSLSKAQSAK